jgi:hypothetical protein
MKEIDLARRVVETADEYHFIAEEQWSQAADVEPVNDETLFEFRRLIRAAIQFYARAHLQLNMKETDDSQSVEDLLEILAEEDGEVAEFLEKNRALDVLDEESTSSYTKIFSIAEAMRSLLLQSSDQLAASLPGRFNVPSGALGGSKKNDAGKESGADEDEAAGEDSAVRKERPSGKEGAADLDSAAGKGSPAGEDSDADGQSHAGSVRDGAKGRDTAKGSAPGQGSPPDKGALPGEQSSTDMGTHSDRRNEAG